MTAERRAGLMGFHALATARSDGLLPELAELLALREAIGGADPAIVELAAIRRDGTAVAGSPPPASAGHFRPGNVIDFAPREAQARTIHPPIIRRQER